MRFLIDECCSVALERALLGIGADTLAVRSIAPGAPDSEVMALGFESDRIIVTHDYDLPELAVRRRAPCIGILLVAYEKAVTTADLERLANLVAGRGEILPGRITIIDGDRVRTRPL